MLACASQHPALFMDPVLSVLHERLGHAQRCVLLINHSLRTRAEVLGSFLGAMT